MMGMILMIAAQMSINLLMSSLQYGLMAYVVARCARKGWEAGRKGK